MKKRPISTRAVVVTGALTAVVTAGGTVNAGAQPMYFSPEQRIHTLAEVPQCLAGTVDVRVTSGYTPDEIHADFTTHLYSPAWVGLADYECYVTMYADWHNHDTGARGTAEHRVASWRFQGPNVTNPYLDIDTGAGPVTVTFRTNTPHTPSPTFEVPAR
jgi:hypothetical protein